MLLSKGPGVIFSPKENLIIVLPFFKTPPPPWPPPSPLLWFVHCLQNKRTNPCDWTHCLTWSLGKWPSSQVGRMERMIWKNKIKALSLLISLVITSFWSSWLPVDTRQHSVHHLVPEFLWCQEQTTLLVPAGKFKPIACSPGTTDFALGWPVGVCHTGSSLETRHRSLNDWTETRRGGYLETLSQSINSTSRGTLSTRDT